MNNKYKVKIINLEHRTDRKNQCIEELNKIGITDYSFIPAIMTTGPRGKEGAIGCALSHARTLCEFMLNDTSYDYCVVFEDDFMVNNKENEQIPHKDIKKHIESAISNSSYWDTFLLAHHLAVPLAFAPILAKNPQEEQVSPTNPAAFKVVNAQTCAGYIVKKAYAPTLIKCFFEAYNYMTAYNGIPSPNREVIREFIAADTIWKKLQIDNNFFAIYPQAIIQRPSFSDIENKEVEYDH